MDDDTPTTMREFEMIRELRQTAGLFDGAMPVSPKAAWQEALTQVGRTRRLFEELRTAIDRIQKDLDRG